MEFQMFEVLGMRLSVTQEELRQLCLEIIAEYTTELAHLARPKFRQIHRSAPEGDKESDRGSDPDFESDKSCCKPEGEDSYIYPLAPLLP